MKRKLKMNMVVVFIFGALISFFLMGCSHNYPNTPIGKYASSITFFNDTVEAYYSLWSIQPKKTQDRWKERYTPIIKAAGEALTVWKTSLGTENEEIAEIRYLQLLQQVLTSMVEIGVIKIES
jgi:hypothetical protein